MKILVLGAGAVGGYFGGKLAQLKLSGKAEYANVDVTFLVRPRREEQLQQYGLLIEDLSKAQQQSTTDDDDDEDVEEEDEVDLIERISPIQTITNDSDNNVVYDVIILACKSYSLESALDALEPFIVVGETCILPLLNGMAHLSQIQDRFPDAIVWGGLCGIVATLTPEDHVVQKMTESQFITAGVLPLARDEEEDDEDDDQKIDVLQELIILMKAAGIDANLILGSESEDGSLILMKMWEKWTFLTTLAASTCLLDGTIGEIHSTTYGTTYIKALYEECHQIATASLGGQQPDPEEQTKIFRRILGYSQANSKQLRAIGIKASMARDLANGQPTEASHIIGDMIERGADHDIPTPMLSIAYCRLQVYENQRLKKLQQEEEEEDDDIGDDDDDDEEEEE